MVFPRLRLGDFFAQYWTITNFKTIATLTERSPSSTSQLINSFPSIKPEQVRNHYYHLSIENY
ncbi:hypothetical protein ACOKW7_11670 [Limnospira platensis CENA597]|uniref:hypothetical protein n=1 Tax=Limnospira platensis TaxID=118562 RepID=UPI003D6F466C